VQVASAIFQQGYCPWVAAGSFTSRSLLAPPLRIQLFPLTLSRTAVPAGFKFYAMDVSVCLDTSHRYSDLLALASRAEAVGLHAVYVPDHFGEFREAWTVLAALAVARERIRVGTLVLSVTHRPTGVLVGMAQTFQEICAGRLILGIGAGWNEAEHAALGLPFPNARGRLDLLEEASAGLRRAVDAPLLVGGAGERRTMRIAATHADAWHAWATPEEFARKCSILDEHCRSVGRRPESIRRATGAEVTGGPDDARLLASYVADEFIARFPHEFTVSQAFAAIEHLGDLIGPADNKFGR
jgi:alkanesulfonate monooxygenase SsuD/methylene tetrahydromethanopterin reductase-like flavin-dependent oxidoreductase (luciferase family)